jgi:hypothetical protein
MLSNSSPLGRGTGLEYTGDAGIMLVNSGTDTGELDATPKGELDATPKGELDATPKGELDATPKGELDATSDTNEKHSAKDGCGVEGIIDTCSTVARGTYTVTMAVLGNKEGSNHSKGIGP